jgi:hypothetical protein
MWSDDLIPRCAKTIERDFAQKLAKAGFADLVTVGERTYGNDDCEIYAPLFTPEFIEVLRRVVRRRGALRLRARWCSSVESPGEVYPDVGLRTSSSGTRVSRCLTGDRVELTSPTNQTCWG